MALYVRFVKERHAGDAQRQADALAAMLLAVAGGTWGFSPEFSEWRRARLE